MANKTNVTPSPLMMNIGPSHSTTVPPLKMTSPWRTTSVPARRPERSNFCPEGTVKALMLIVVHFFALTRQKREEGSGQRMLWSREHGGRKAWTYAATSAREEIVPTHRFSTGLARARGAEARRSRVARVSMA